MIIMTNISRLLSAFNQYAPQADEKLPVLFRMGGWFGYCNSKKQSKNLDVSKICVNTHIYPLARI